MSDEYLASIVVDDNVISTRQDNQFEHLQKWVLGMLKGMTLGRGEIVDTKSRQAIIRYKKTLYSCGTLKELEDTSRDTDLC